MNAWSRNIKKSNVQMEHNHKHKTINQINNAAAGHGNESGRTQRQRGCPTRLHYRTTEKRIQWID